MASLHVGQELRQIFLEKEGRAGFCPLGTNDAVRLPGAGSSSSAILQPSLDPMQDPDSALSGQKAVLPLMLAAG